MLMLICPCTELFTCSICINLGCSRLFYWQVYTKNEHRGSVTHVSFPLYFEVHTQGTVIRLSKGKIVTVRKNQTIFKCPLVISIGLSAS